jgi:4-amino-4-deoxy-L-arabinose transferase-like glycosyltransferase
MIGAVFVTLISSQVSGRGGALVAALFFLVWPYGVVASRAFLPEPLMIALMAAGFWAAFHWHAQRDRWEWAVAAGLLCGLSIYIKPVAAFFLVPALAVLVLSGEKIRQIIRRPQIWAMALLVLVPYGIYHIDGVYIQKYLVGQLSLRFFPQMWLDPAFYLRWIGNLGRVAPFEIILAAVLGTFIIKRPSARAALLAMWVGYFVYGMALSHHISTHDYYHMPLLPVMAIGLGGWPRLFLRTCLARVGWRRQQRLGL